MAQDEFSNRQFKRPQKPLGQKKRPTPPNNNWILWVSIGFIFLYLMSQSNAVAPVTPPQEMTYGEFYSLVIKNKDTQDIKKL
jgi:hypothetical protein